MESQALHTTACLQLCFCLEINGEPDHSEDPPQRGYPHLHSRMQWERVYRERAS